MKVAPRQANAFLASIPAAVRALLLHGNDLGLISERARKVARRIDTGMVFINQPTGVKADVPFGGVKHSGYGHELIDLGIKEFVNQKVVVVSDIDGSF